MILSGIRRLNKDKSYDTSSFPESGNRFKPPYPVLPEHRMR